jgi:ABC-type transporter Mla subunit MlaD
MEIIGNDNRIRALFSELKAVDANAAPGFTAVWHGAQARSLRPRRAFNLSFGLVTALLVLTLGSFAVWSTYLHRSNGRYEVRAELKANDMLVVRANSRPADVTTSNTLKQLRRPIRSRINRSVMRNELLIARTRDAKTATIDTWQSPTAALLTSPADGLFKSLPQLNENANELKSFLPGRANEKEK